MAPINADKIVLDFCEHLRAYFTKKKSTFLFQVANYPAVTAAPVWFSNLL